MIARYTLPEMGGIWEDDSRYQKWLDVELAVCEVQTERGMIPKAAWETIKAKAGFDAARILEIEETVQHDVIAFLTSVAERVGPDSRYIHLGMTSSDVLDTATSLQLQAAGRILLSDLAKLREALGKRAVEHKRTVCIGRTHGIHAEPTSFGLKLAMWFDEIGRQITRLERAVDEVSVGKISGAVGTFAHLEPEVEEKVCRKLGLHFAPISTQVIQRDRHAHFLSVLAGIAATLEKIAVEIRHLQRTEVGEAEEYFSKGQKGSSAMPHKRNPIVSERIAGLARILRANATAALENVALWHERDISHSSVERVILPDSTILLDYMLNKAVSLIARLVVYPDRMRENLEKTHGVIFSQVVLLALVQTGATREEAYVWVQEASMKCWNEGGDFAVEARNHPEIRKRLSDAEFERCFDLNHQLRHVDYLFKRVGLN
jgi:adenylosuccinate lyase